MKLKPVIFILAQTLLILLVFITDGISQNQQLNFVRIDGPLGKPIGKIRNMTQDPHGYMWFSGEGENCIYRYDGTRIIEYRKDDNNPNSLGGKSVSAVFADQKGLIWIGLNQDGVDQYNPATGIFKHYKIDEENSDSISKVVMALLSDSKGRLWVGTDRGLHRLDENTGRFIHYRPRTNDNKSLSSMSVSNIYEDRQGTIWIATGYPWDLDKPEDGGLNRFESDGSFTRYRHDPSDSSSLINNKVRAIFEDSHGTLWVGTAGDGLHSLDRKTGRFKRFSYTPQNPDQLSRPPLKTDKNGGLYDHISFITEDIVGSIWIGTMSAGINRYDPATKKTTHFEASNGFPDKSAWNGFQSREGVLWLCTQENQLYRVDPFRITLNFTPTTDQVFRFFEDDDRSLWVGTYEGGLLKYDRQGKLIETFKHSDADPYSLFDSLNIVLSFFQNQKDTLWLGTANGVGTYSKSSRRFSKLPMKVRYDTAIRRNPFTGIYQEKTGMKWLASWGSGLVSYDQRNQSIKQYMNDPLDSTSIGFDIVFTFMEDKGGKTWISGNKGLDLMDRKTGKFYHYLKGFTVLRLIEDSEGILWVGSEKGIYQYERENDRFINFLDPESEVGNANITDIIEDAANNFWLLTPSSIIKLNRKTKEAVVYADKIGIGHLSMQPRALYLNSEGKILAGHQSGFFSFRPEELTAKEQALEIVVSEIMINNNILHRGAEAGDTVSIEETKELQLSYKQNNVSFSFAALDYREPQAIRYYTMLENHDNVWREIRGEKNSDYFNLQPGSFVYRIKAFTSTGLAAEKRVIIIIHPPWWKTWWAFSIYGLLFILLLYLLFRYQKERVIRLERQKSQQFELAQAKEIEKAYHQLKATQLQLVQSEKMASLGELTAGIAHEIQNPLNFINNFSEINRELIEEMKAELKKGNYSQAESIAADLDSNESKITHHGKRADAIVKGMLQHSRSSTGIKEPTDINALADEYLRLSYHGLRARDKSFNATMKTDFDSAVGAVNIIPQDIGRVFLNIINNAFYAVNEKKAKAPLDYEPAVSVTTKRSSGKITISIADNGNGMSRSIVDKIFNPFFTTKPSGQGTGLGLSLSYDIVKAHGGEIRIETAEGKGSEFIIVLDAV